MSSPSSTPCACVKKPSNKSTAGSSSSSSTPVGSFVDTTTTTTTKSTNKVTSKRIIDPHTPKSASKATSTSKLRRQFRRVAHSVSKTYFKVKGRGQLCWLGIGVGVCVLALIGIVIYCIVQCNVHKGPNRLTASINWSVDPCEDFHEHACGNWIRPLLDSGHKMTILAPDFANPKVFERGLAYNLKSAKSRAVSYVTSLITACRQKKGCNKFGSIGSGLKHFHISTRYVVERIYLDGLACTDAGERTNQLVATKTQVIEMVAHLRDVYRDMLTGNQWLDEQTLSKALEKLTALKETILYSDWMMDDAMLDEWHGLSNGAQLHYDEGESFKRNLQNWEVHLSRRKPRSFKIENWPDWLYQVNAVYDRFTNGMYIPAAIAQYPNFDMAEPDSVNYGKLGFVIGHEMSHAFDNQGRKYDKDGSVTNWWSEGSAVRFNEHTQCLVEQYSNITVQWTNQTIDGIVSLGENIADNGGVKAAYLAFVKHTEHLSRTMVKLPSTSMAYANFTSHQLFFYAFAQLYCEIYTKDEASDFIANSLYAWYKYRVNVPLSNMDQFAGHFKCPPGSAMNPLKKCVIW